MDAMNWNLEGGKDLDKHVGHKIEVTGHAKNDVSGDQPKSATDDKEQKARDFDVKSMKMIASSCSVEALSLTKARHTVICYGSTTAVGEEYERWAVEATAWSHVTATSGDEIHYALDFAGLRDRMPLIPFVHRIVSSSSSPIY